MKLHEDLKEEDYLKLKDGRTIQSLKELALVLSDLSDEVFHHHVSDNKNDFAEWIQRVIKDEELAKHLMESLKKEGHEKVIFRHIVKNYVKD